MRSFTEGSFGKAGRQETRDHSAGGKLACHGVLEKDVNFIQKPFMMQDLAAKLREVLDSKDLNRNEADILTVLKSCEQTWSMLLSGLVNK
jgi:hypothetical protein